MLSIFQHALLPGPRTRDAESLFFYGTPTPTPGLILCDIMIVYFMDDLREILNSSNTRCTILYKQSFSCKINCTEVKYTATKLHMSPDKTDRARSRGLLQKTDSDSDFDSTPLPMTQGSTQGHNILDKVGSYMTESF